MMLRTAPRNPVALMRTTTVCRVFRQGPPPKPFRGMRLTCSVDPGPTGNGVVTLNRRLVVGPAGPCCRGSSQALARILQPRAGTPRFAFPGKSERSGDWQTLHTSHRALRLVRRETILVASTPWQCASLPSRLRIGDHERGDTLGAFPWRGDSRGPKR